MTQPEQALEDELVTQLIGRSQAFNKRLLQQMFV